VSNWSSESACDGLGICRALVKRGFLASHHRRKRRSLGYSRGPNWPAPASFFESGPIGFVYMLQIWFRHYFKEHIALSFRLTRP